MFNSYINLKKSMKYFKSITVLLLIIFTVTSCSLENGVIQKRRYQKGYYISIANNKKEVKGINKSSDKETTIIEKNNCNKMNKEKVEVAQYHEKSQIKNRHSKKINKTELRNKKEITSQNENKFINKNKGITNKLKKLRNNSQELTNNTAKHVNQLNDNIINLILAIALVVAIIMLLSFLDGLLGGILSLILLIVIIVLLLSYFGIV